MVCQKLVRQLVGLIILKCFNFGFLFGHFLIAVDKILDSWQNLQPFSAYCSTKLEFRILTNSSRRGKMSSAAFPRFTCLFCNNCDTLPTFTIIFDSKCSNVTQVVFLSGYGPEENLFFFLSANSTKYGEERTHYCRELYSKVQVLLRCRTRVGRL